MSKRHAETSRSWTDLTVLGSRGASEGLEESGTGTTGKGGMERMDSVVERRGSYDQGQPLLGDDSEAGSDEDKLGLGGEAKAEHHHHKSKISSWTNTSLIMCANLMGAGVLALPAVMKDVGWIPGLGLIALLAFGAVYSGILITRIWMLADQRKFPAEKYGDLGRFAYGETGQRVVNSVTYFYITVVTVVFHLAAAESMQTVFYDVGGNLCLWQYSALTIIIVLPFAQIRSLQNVSLLAIIGSVTIIGTVLIAVARLLQGGPLEGAHTVLINTSRKDIRPKVNSLVLIVFSYCGQAIFTELISSMQKPKDFPKAVWSSTLTMMGSYILIASVGYACLGALAIAPVTDALPEDFWAQIANVLLFGHVLVAYIIELNILTKGMIHAWHTLDPAHWPTGRSKAAKIRRRVMWGLSTCILIGGSFLLSNTVSFFSELLAFAGATGGIATTYIFPCLFIIKVDQGISNGERRLCKTIIVVAIIFSVVCLCNTVLDIMQKWKDIGPPFMCMSCDYKKANNLTPGVC